MRKAVIPLAALAVLSIFWGLYYHGFAHAIGIDTQLSEEYAFFSGFGTFALAALGYTGITATAMRAVNCHVHGCWRVGYLPAAGGAYKICRRHHRQVAPPEHHKLTVDVLRRLHLEHHARTVPAVPPPWQQQEQR